MKRSSRNCIKIGAPLKILIFDLNTNSGSILQELLEADRYDVDLCSDVEQVRQLCRLNNYAACIIYSQDPINNYYRLATEIKTINERISIIFIGYHYTKEEAVGAYNHSVDSFIRKPVDHDIIKAYLFAILKRTHNIKSSKILYYKFGTYTFDLQKQILSIGDKNTRLTSIEYEMLKVLCENVNKLVDRAYMLKSVWKNEDSFNARSMDVYVTKLRQLLKEDSYVNIVNVHGKGYKLVTQQPTIDANYQKNS